MSYGDVQRQRLHGACVVGKSKKRSIEHEEFVSIVEELNRHLDN
jgi:hypothetical protein